MKCNFETYMKIEHDGLEKYLSRKDEIKNHLDSLDSWAGWYDFKRINDEKLINEITMVSDEIRNNADVFLVVGIGGSYLGAKAVIEALSPYFHNDNRKTKIYFIGTSLSSDYMHDMLELIKDKSVYINVISKSGTTTETAVAYEILMKFMKSKYDNDELKKRFIMTTNTTSGYLKEEADKYGFRMFEIPDDIGGRYSVFTSVGLLPIATSGLDIKEIMRGVAKSYEYLTDEIKYAGIKDYMYKNNTKVEAFVIYEPKLYYFAEWLKQLYGESLGKEGKGILPISFINTADLHSLGQFVQDGSKILFETVLDVTNSKNDFELEKYSKSLNEINQITTYSVCEAHLKGDVMSSIITIPELNEYHIGGLMQFFMISCAISAYLLGVNAFNQPGVEEYKNAVRDNLKF